MSIRKACRGADAIDYQDQAHNVAVSASQVATDEPAFDIDDNAAQATSSWEQPADVAAESYGDSGGYGATPADTPPNQYDDVQTAVEAQEVAAVAQENAPYREEFAMQASDIVDDTHKKLRRPLNQKI